MPTIQSAAAAVFNPAVPGTPESVWRKSLALHPLWTPPRGPLLVVSPHPDDEVLGAGGLMRLWNAWRLPVSLVSVSDGEAAFPEWPELQSLRRAELDLALRVLTPSGIPTLRLRLPDGAGEANKPALRQALVALCRHRPTLIAPYEHDGHPDHECAGQVCLQIAQELNLPIARYPIWAWHHRHPRHFEGMRFGRVALDSVGQRAKAEAIHCFASQLFPGKSRLPGVPPHVLDYFRREYEAFLL